MFEFYVILSLNDKTKEILRSEANMSELNDLVRFESYYMLIQTRKHIEISSKYRFFPIEEILEEDSPKKALLAGLIGGS